jgi:hypothetical protein
MMSVAGRPVAVQDPDALSRSSPAAPPAHRARRGALSPGGGSARSVVLGTGKRLFADGALPRGLKLVDSKTSTTGVLIATYERGGEVEYGSFALEEPTEAELQRRQRRDG